MAGRTSFSHRLAGFGIAAVALAAFAAPLGMADAQAPMGMAQTQGAWSASAARDLLAVIADAGEEGLDPASYSADRVRAALASGDAATLDAAADAAALMLARDYSQGRIADKAAFDWYIERSPYETAALAEGLRDAVASDKVTSWYKGLLPQNKQYRALRTALAETGDAATRDRIRANMERWRWMPRSLGSDYVYVNVPSYQLQVVQGGTPVSTYDVVVGAPATPTPMLAMTASSVVVNPWWNVPESIAKKGLGRGFEAVRTADGSVRYRQAPGPRNALGRIKIDMPNDHAIYLHDTPAKAGFAKADRALSHGCIRVKDIDQLASELMTRSDNRAALDEALTTADTKTLRLQDRWPVYLVYFTVEADGGSVKTLADPYRRDAALVASLDRALLASRDRGPVMMAAR